MHLAELLAAELAALRARSRPALTILETGTIRGDSEEYRSNDGWSTVMFAEHVRAYSGKVYSVDLDTTTAAAVLARHGLCDMVTLIEGYSIDILAGMVHSRSPQVDVVYLDSGNDAELILHEYLLAKRLVRPPGMILVDDVDIESDNAVKGHRIVPWLDTHGMRYRIKTRAGQSYTTGVLIVEV